MPFDKTIINNTTMHLKVGAILRVGASANGDRETNWTSGELAPGTREVLRLTEESPGRMPYLNGLDFVSRQSDTSVRWHVTTKGKDFDTTINTNDTLIITGSSLEHLNVGGRNT